LAFSATVVVAMTVSATVSAGWSTLPTTNLIAAPLTQIRG